MTNEVNNTVPTKRETPESCPHCGQKLSKWQQVILSVDRVLMCKKCWYRIILDIVPNEPQKTEEDKKKE
jgi:DNA-directed RNA polymerase subunit RPC12/RpoP